MIFSLSFMARPDTRAAAALCAGGVRPYCDLHHAGL